MTAQHLTALDTDLARSVLERYRWLIAILAGLFALVVFSDFLPSWMVVPPKVWTENLPMPFLAIGEGLLPSFSIKGSAFADWLNELIGFLRNHEIFGLFTFKDVTRSIAKLMDWPLNFVEGLLISGFPHRKIKIPFEIAAVPWVVSAGLSAVLGWWLGGWRLALMSGSCIAYFAVFGLWKPAMTTLSLVLVSAPIAMAIGLLLGIGALKWQRMERALAPILNLMQSLPHFGYLIPIVVFVGLGHRAGAIATIIFAVPVMAKISIVALRNVPKEVLEAGVMAGCTPRQMLLRVRIPAARRMLLVGVNQVIMLCLAMNVIASFIGARGLGIDLLQRLQSLQLGRALEIGVAIVLMAVVLDRLSHQLVEKEPEHTDEGSFWKVHPYLTAAGLVFVIGSVLAALVPEAAKLPRAMTITFSAVTDASIKGAVSALYEPLTFIREDLLVLVLLPIRDFFKALPWTVFFGVLVFLGWRLGGLRMAVITGLYIGFIVLSSWWTEFMVTTFLVFVAVVVCVLIGFPLAVFASRWNVTNRIVIFLCDTFQTFPSFIYLIPVVMLFQVGTVSQIMAIVIYSAIPVVRYTLVGLRGVPNEIIEGATTSGCTRLQTLWKVRLPLAFPEIMLGLNQTIMFGLFMVMIAGFIGGNNDLAKEIFKAKANNDAGLGLTLALCVAFLGLATDQLMQAWAQRRREQLGLA